MKIIGRCLVFILVCLAHGKIVVADTGCSHRASFTLTLNDNSLSLDSQNACLGMILKALADQGPVRIHVPPSVAGQPVSASFQNLPLQQGIRRMLKGMNYALENKARSRPGEPPARSEKIRLWVFSKMPEVVSRQTGDRKESSGKGGQNDTPDLMAMAEQSRSAADPQVRAYALQLIAQTDDPTRTAEMLLAGLQDPAPEVLSAALSAADDLEPGAAARIADRIAEIALYDGRPGFRKQALRTLIKGDFPPEITAAVMAQARYDNDSGVNNLADKLFRWVTPRPAHGSGR